MSGGLEVAAGAFAVVGVADVLIRTGRELYNFLRDIEGAPATADRLRDSVAEVLALAGTSRSCLLQLNTRTRGAPVTETANTLSSALKALGREVKSLQAIAAKCRGTSKRWLNIRYALSEQRIDKALRNLEQSKSLLTSALTLADRELTGIEHEHIEELVQEGTHRVTSDLDNTSRAIQTRLDTHEQSASSRQRRLETKLDTHHHVLTTLHESHSDSLTAIRRAQARAATSQDRCVHALHSHSRASDTQHQKTRDLLVTTVHSLRDNHACVAHATARPRRQIEYAGEDRDLIVPALYFLKRDFAAIFDRLVTEHGQDVWPSQAAWLQSELQSLVASAAQEDARSHAGSTAGSFDTWSYPALRHAAATESSLAAISLEGEQTDSALLKRRKYEDQILSFRTSQGVLRVRLPRRSARHPRPLLHEADLSYYLFGGDPFMAVSAHFAQLSDRLISPRIRAHLQIVLPRDPSQSGCYVALFRYGSIQDFDRALREGAVSLYRHAAGWPECNVVFLFAGIYERLDFIRYLDTQGVRYSSSQHSSALLTAVSVAAEADALGSVRVQDLLSCCAEPTQLLADALVMCLSTLGDADRTKTTNLVSVLDTCLSQLHRAAPAPFDPQTLQWDLPAIPPLVQHLLALGADPNMTVMGRSLVGYLLASPLFRQCLSSPHGLQVSTQVLSALIEAGADVLHNDGDTVADIAWGFGHWDAWCEAVRANGLSVAAPRESVARGCWIASRESGGG